MDQWEKKVIKFVLGGIAIFLVGVAAGYHLENNSIQSIQGFLFNAAGFATDANATDANATDANATDANATDANATDANATDANATSANATDANATDANANITDNIIYLQDFYVENKIAKTKEKLNVRINTVGAPLSGATIIFKNQILGVSFSTKIESLYNNPYVVIPSGIPDATYTAEEVLVIGKNSNNTTFSKKYSLNTEENHLPTRYEITIKNESVAKTNLELTELILKQTFGNTGEKVDLTFKSTMTLDSLKLKFESENDEFSVTVKDVNKNPYFEIPSTAKEGQYKLKRVIISSEQNTKMYSTSKEENTESLPFDIAIEIIKEESEKPIYSNDKITSEMITQIYNATSDIEIEADNDTLIQKDVFDAFKGKNNNLTINIRENQIVFKGSDIKDTKAIDASMKFERVSEHEIIKNLLSEGLVMILADNGTLPGQAIYRIKESETKGELSDNIYVYSYNSNYNKFVLVASNVKKNSEGYYEFKLTHNSDYVLVNKELDSSITMIEEEETVDFQKSNKSNILLIVIGIVIVLIATIVIIVVRRIKKSQKPQNM